MKTRKIAGVAVCALTICGVLAGCGKKSDVKYTFHDSLEASPDTWSPHSWKNNDSTSVLDYTTSSFFEFQMKADKSGYEIVPEMAESLEDVSSTLTAEEYAKYGMEAPKEGTVPGQKWKVTLNPEATWEDGEPINADTYIESLDRLLDPEMQNFRADTLYSGDAAVGNAEGRFKSGRLVLEGRANDDGLLRDDIVSADNKIYANLYTTVPAWGLSIAGTYDYVGGNESDFPLYTALLADSDTWGTSASPKDVELIKDSDTYKALYNALNELYTKAFGASIADTLDLTGEDTVGLFTFIKVANPEVPFENVGMVKTGEYELTFYLVRPCTEFQFKYNINGTWLVDTELYDANTTTVGSLKSSTYGTSVDKYKSYGPYKLTSFTLDKEIVLERNDAWEGYKKDIHKGQYQTTGIHYDIIPERNTILQQFLQGKLDGYAVRSEDVALYGMSSQLKYIPQSYTDKIATNSEFNSLKARQSAGENKTIMANAKFRKALSWALDRQTFVQTQAAGSAVALGVINPMYVTDPNTGELYRETSHAKKVISDIYGESKTGFDIEKARDLLNEAIAEEKASTREGHYTTGDKVVLDWAVYNEGWDNAINFVINNWKELVKGTELEGNFDVKITHDTELAETIKSGQTDFAMDIWGGNQMNPYSIPDTWINAENRTCYGYNPDSETIDIDLDNNGTIETATERKTNTAWYYELNNGEYSSAKAETDVRVKILSELEKYMLSKQYFITVRSRQSLAMNSFRVKDGTDTYLQLVGFGGIQYLTYTMDDATWADYCANNKLDYTK